MVLSRRRSAGMVTAEFAVIAPFAVLFVVGLVWVSSLGLTQVRLVDASREAARLVARGEAVSHAEQVARAQAPAGATVSIDQDDGIVTVRVTVRSRSVFANVGAVDLSATSVAAAEEP